MSGSPKTDDPATKAWKAVMSLVGIGGGRPPLIPRVGQQFGLSPKQLVLIWQLSPGETVSMREIGDSLFCDASFVTNLVDRLEEEGLIERRADPDDRRVTLVALTSKGAALREQAVELIYKPPAEFDALEPEELRQLAKLLEKAVSAN
jgi:DNA-binding MarR family transcriptional regulator